MNTDRKIKPALLLLPNVLGDVPYHEPFLPAAVDKAVASLDGLIAESATAGRRYLSRFETKRPVNEVPIALYNEHTPDKDLDFLLEPIKKGEVWGLVSDAGLPCIADPGSKLVSRARQVGIEVKAFVGPSSAMLALMLSGLPGQRFTFLGYLPKEPAERRAAIIKLQRASKNEQATQIFIEAPYRNRHTLEALIETLEGGTLLTVVWDLTLRTQGVQTFPVEVWRKNPLPNLEKKCVTFLVFHK